MNSLMRSRQFAIMALSLFGIITCVSSVQFNSGFSIAPVQVLNVTETPKWFTDPFLALTGNLSTLAVIGMDDVEGSYNFTRRIVNTNNFSSVGNDTNLPFNISTTDVPLIASSPDGFLMIGAASNVSDYTQVFINLYPPGYGLDNLTNYTQIQLTTNNNSRIDYDVSQFLYLNGYFYVIFASYSNLDEDNVTLCIQGFATSSTNQTKFGKPLQLNPSSINITSSAFVSCGQHGTMNMLLCMWRELETNATTVYVTINLESGSVSTRTQMTVDRGDDYHTPLAVVNGDKYCAALLAVSNNTDSLSQLIYKSMKVKLSYLPPTYTLPYSLPSNAEEFKLAGASSYYGGWFVIFNQFNVSNKTHQRSSIGINFYQKDSSMNGTQRILAENGTVNNMIVHPNGGVYVLIKNTTSKFGGGWDVSYLAQLFPRTSYPNPSKFADSIARCFILMVAVLALYMI